MKKLTEPQIKLLEIVSEMIFDRAMPLDKLKSLSNFKSFDGTFNALLEKGYVRRVKTDDYTNQFILNWKS